jgi:uncharacterized membrane protein
MPMFLRLAILFGVTRSNSLVMQVKCNVILVYLEIAIILAQHRGMVCAERTIGWKIILDAPDGTPT